jgi:hypothetical protein
MRSTVAKLGARSLVAVVVALIAAGSAGAASSIPNGVYHATYVAKDLQVSGVSVEDRQGNLGTWTLTLKSGSWTLVNKAPAGYPPGDHIAGTYSSSGGVVTFLHKTPHAYAGVAPKVTWSFDGTALHLKPVSGFPAKVVSLVWTKHAWTKIK